MRPPTSILQELIELVDRNPRLPDDGAESAFVQHRMVWNYQTTNRISAFQDDMTSALAINDEADLQESAEASSARDRWQLAQTATTSA